MSQNKLYELNVINDTLGGNKEMIETMLQIFVQSISETISVLNEAVSNKDITMAEKALHKCRPSVLMICQKSVTDLFLEIESFVPRLTKDTELQKRFFESVTLFCGQLSFLSVQLKEEFGLN